MDAFEYKIKVDGPLAAHGGFSFRSSDYEYLSHATVGASREPINAWLPLFITPTHWTRVKVVNDIIFLVVKEYVYL